MYKLKPVTYLIKVDTTRTLVPGTIFFFNAGILRFLSPNDFQVNEIEKMVFIIHAAKTLSIAFVFYGETPIYQNRDETSLDGTKKVVFLTLVSKNMSVHVL